MGHHSNTLYAAKLAGMPRPANTWPRWIVTGGGLGFLKPAPGSWGTVGPALTYWLLLYYQFPDPWRSGLLLAGALAASILLVAFGPWACAYFQKIDPGQVVLDEFAGFWIAGAFVKVPASLAHGAGTTWLFTAGLFILFRLTDTLKIPPANYLERLPWGWGILLDDIAAGVQANLLAWVLIWAIWR
ncbi:MAG: phosphatidylglycerophosphatase A [Phycisphaerae bacterium]